MQDGFWIHDVQFKFFQPSNSHKWPRQYFSLRYQYNINQTSDENKEKYQSEDY